MPIFHWHGQTECTEKGYVHLSREAFPWVRERRTAEVESRYVLFLYRQIANILDALEGCGATEDHKRALFKCNAMTALDV